MPEMYSHWADFLADWCSQIVKEVMDLQNGDASVVHSFLGLLGASLRFLLPGIVM